MDTLTHALSGALLARLICARPAAAALPHEVARVLAPAGRFGAAWDQAPGHLAPWQVVVVGALAAAFPDIDAVTQAFGEFVYLRHHRGVTHSVLMAPLWAAVLAAIFARWFAATRERAGGWKALYVPVLAALLIHIAGDWITPFGTMMLAPFSDARLGLGAMFIIDLGFSGILIAALGLAALLPRRRWPAALGLAGAAAWVALAWVGQQEAEAAGRAYAQARGVRAETVEAMPRPASPFNWTVAVFDGHEYHLAHINTRRKAPLVAGPDDFFVRRFSAPYLPVDQAQWTRLPRLGGEGTPPWVKQAWEHEVFATFRWFAQAPSLLEAVERSRLATTAPRAGDAAAAGMAAGASAAGPNAAAAIDASADPQAEAERCAAFRDLRFETPGREGSPFRYAVCLGGAGQARVFRLEGPAWRPI
ncbi:MAG: metal-dependent hydrolase [Rubrivivax sp.]|nr:metal-dependent hydrolase [Rubrivivax sp.]